MFTSEFDYDLPVHLIAQHGKENRTSSRLMCVNKRNHNISDRHFYELPDILAESFSEKVSLVVNNTKVMKARLFCEKPTGGRIELLLLKHLGENRFSSLVRGKVSLDMKLTLATASARVTGRSEDGSGSIYLEFDRNPFLVMEDEGHTPLPPYMNREDSHVDAAAYQTVFANHLGSVASSTASIHFDDELLGTLRARGVNIHEITLHIGLGTFKPISTDTIHGYNIHSEYYQIDSITAEAINLDRESGRKIVCVGSTSVRALESNMLLHTHIGTSDSANPSKITPYAGETNLYIKPGFEFQIADGIITNFHMPRTTLLVMMSSYYNLKNLLDAYEYAKSLEYQFYSYGDAMFMY